MRSMKHLVKQIFAAALSLCLLVPCGASAAESLQTPDWMQGWSGTRTSSVIAQLEKDQFTAEVKIDGMNGILDVVRSDGKMYLKATKPDGTDVLTLLIRDGSTYQLDSAGRQAVRIGDESAAYAALGLSESVVKNSLATGKATGFTKTKKTINGKTYDAEVFDMKMDGKPVEMTYCYDGDGALRYLITSVDGKQASMEYRSVSDKVDESLLRIPKGYTITAKSESNGLGDVYDVD